MLIELKKGAGSWVARIFIGILAASFAVWGIADVFRGPSDQAVAMVDDREITVSQFATEFQRELYRLQRMVGPEFSQQQALAIGLDRQVLQQMVMRALYDEQAAELGLTTPNEAVLEAIQSNEAFRDPFGGIDRIAFEQALRQSGFTEEQFIRETRKDLTRQQLIAAIMSGTEAPLAMAEALYKVRFERRVAEYLHIPQSAAGEIKAPDEAELAEFHQSNPELFTAPEYRAATYVWLKPRDLMAEVAVAEEEIREAYDYRLNEFTTIGRRDFLQIVVEDEERAQEAANALEGGGDFLSVAQKYGESEPDTLADLRLTGVTRSELGDISEDLAARVFALGRGDTDGPIETPLGFHIVRVENVARERVKAYDEVRDQLRDGIARERAEDALYDLANRLEDERGGGATLEDAAAAIGVTPQKIKAIDRDGLNPDGERVEDIPDRQAFVTQIFRSGIGEENDLSETPDGGFYVLRVDDVTPSALRPLASVRDEVASAWRAREIAERLEARAKEIAKRAEAGTALAVIAEEIGAEVKTSARLTRRETDGELTPTLVSNLFDAEKGDVVMAPGATQGFVVARLEEVIVPSPAENTVAVASVRDEMTAAIAQDVLTEYQAALQQDFDVRINSRAVDAVFATPE